MLKLRVIFITSLLSVCLLPARAQVQPHVTVPQDLSGVWRFVLDRNDEGVNQQWFTVRLPQFIRLPGILQDQNQGDEITTKTPWVSSLYDRFWYLREEYKEYTERPVKIPFLSQPPRHYLGVAWYQRDVIIQQNWAGRRVVLTLERPHWETTVWLDNKKIGSERSLVTPHVFDLGTVTPGRHQITIRVDNRMIMPYRQTRTVFQIRWPRVGMESLERYSFRLQDASGLTMHRSFRGLPRR